MACLERGLIVLGALLRKFCHAGERRGRGEGGGGVTEHMDDDKDAGCDDSPQWVPQLQANMMLAMQLINSTILGALHAPLPKQSLLTEIRIDFC